MSLLGMPVVLVLLCPASGPESSPKAPVAWPLVPEHQAGTAITPFEIVDRVIYVQGTIEGSRPLWFPISSGSGGSLDLGTAREIDIMATAGTARSGPVTAVTLSPTL